MISALLKALCLIATAIAGSLLVVAVFRKRARLQRWHVQRKTHIEVAVDRAGIRAPQRVIALLAIVDPLARMLFLLLWKRRMRQADSQLADAMSFLGNALKAGIGLSQAIEMAGAELPVPLGEEFARAAAEQRLGRTVEEALALFEARLPTEEVGLFVQSVEVLRRTGGNLVETFTQLAQTLEERRRVAEKIRALTAQGIAQAIVLLLLPWGLAGALHLVAPEFIAPLFTTRLGLVLLGVTVALEAAGALWLRKIVVLRV
jgi:tight adherence protein B